MYVLSLLKQYISEIQNAFCIYGKSQFGLTTFQILCDHRFNYHNRKRRLQRLLPGFETWAPLNKGDNLRKSNNTPAPRFLPMR